MTELLYMNDSYLREWESVIEKASSKFVVLGKTAFYPQGGGVPCDNGTIKRNEEEFKVLFVKKIGDSVSLELDREGLKEGDRVHCKIDWEKRYKHMRMHTAAHILSSIINKKTGALITGNQISIDKTRIDFSLEQMDRERFKDYVRIANEEIQRDIQVRVYFMKRDDALKIPDMVKLANALPPDGDNLRIVEIGDIDTQADGGPHVATTKEIGKIEIVGFENKGKNNRRIYYTLK